MGRLLKEVHVLHRYPFLREHALEGRRRAFPAEDPSRLGVDLPVDPLRLVPAYLPDVRSLLHVSPYQPVAVLVASSVPGTVRTSDAFLLLTGILTRNRVLRSTRVRYAPLMPSFGPTTRSPSQCPNSFRRLTAAGRSDTGVPLDFLSVYVFHFSRVFQAFLRGRSTGCVPRSSACLPCTCGSTARTFAYGWTRRRSRGKRWGTWGSVDTCRSSTKESSCPGKPSEDGMFSPFSNTIVYPS